MKKLKLTAAAIMLTATGLWAGQPLVVEGSVGFCSLLYDVE